jgi:hypothetical protein
MSTPTTSSFAPGEGGASREVGDFVAAVRAQLDDLAAEEVTELTGGLEADLTDALAESGGTPAEHYGDPAEYARELRAAAGLPPRGSGRSRRRPPRRSLAVELEESLFAPTRKTLGQWMNRLEEQPWWPSVRDFLVVLRPAWWVLRAWVVVRALLVMLGAGDAVVPAGAVGLILLLGAVWLSVQAGRRGPLTLGRRELVAGWNVVAAVVLLPLLFLSIGDQAYDSGDYEPPGGLSSNGTPLNNIFPYDSQGRPLTGVQLYDQDGHPLDIDESNRTWYDETTGGQEQLVPGSPPGSAPRWNAFPLMVQSSDPRTGQPGPVVAAPLPLSGVPPLLASPTPETLPSTPVSPEVTPTPKVRR